MRISLRDKLAAKGLSKILAMKKRGIL